MKEELIQQIALGMIPGVGGVTARKLISYCGSVEGIFKEKSHNLMKIPGIGQIISRGIKNHKMFERAEKEVAFIEKHNIKAYFFLDKDYPARLKHCEDGPVVLYVKGDIDLNAIKVVGVVGTRSVTGYGREKCNELLRGLAPHKAVIISGLAYGVDACAHKAALENNLFTGAVLGHGLDQVYPPLHRQLAEKITEQGALISEFTTETRPDRENFPKRNRIIAGLCDAIIVVEAASSGGALITANIANSYNRDVFAVPGRTYDKFSEGCNNLIKSNKANLLAKIEDFQYIMGWDLKNPSGKTQQSLFIELDEEEKTLVGFLKTNPDSGIDHIVARAGFTLGKVSSLLLNLEFKGVIKTLPGKHFRVNGSF